MAKKVFISYSWTTPTHEDWVLELAKRLISDGIEVILDKWDLKPGHNKFAFMESMVHAEDIDKVLIILDCLYAEKANGRAGGVGTETLIISTKVYESTKQTKFIPIIAQLDDKGNAPLPTYLSGNIYIDLSSRVHYEENYEKLLRDIYERPSTSRPKLGIPPKYIFEDTPVTYRTNALLRSFDYQLDNHPSRINGLIKEFFESIEENLQEFKIEGTANTYALLGEQILNIINNYTPLRDDYIAFLNKLFKHHGSFDETIFVSFFESLSKLTVARDQSTNNQDLECFKIIRLELFLYTILIGLKKENYSVIDELLNSKYLYSEYYRSNVEPKSYESFYHYSEILQQHHRQVHNQNVFSAIAALLTKRVPEGFTKDEFVDADLLCYQISKMRNGEWFPQTYVYKSEYSNHFPFFSKLFSLRYFEKVKSIFNVTSVSDVKEKFIAIDAKDERGYSGSFRSLPKVSDWIKIDNIGTSR